MRSYRLRTIIFLALCCDLGLFSKRLIAPAANVITDALHIPGGIGTSFSLMFLVVAAMMVPRFGCATIMGIVQSVIALSLGMVGSMGALSPVGYIVPGIAVDLLVALARRLPLSRTEKAVLTNATAGVCAALTANLIVFRLQGAALVLYLCVAASSGAICGIPASELVRRLAPVIGRSLQEETIKEEIEHEKEL